MSDQHYDPYGKLLTSQQQQEQQYREPRKRRNKKTSSGELPQTSTNGGKKNESPKPKQRSTVSWIAVGMVTGFWGWISKVKDSRLATSRLKIATFFGLWFDLLIVANVVFTAVFASEMLGISDNFSNALILAGCFTCLTVFSMAIIILSEIWHIKVAKRKDTNELANGIQGVAIQREYNKLLASGFNLVAVFRGRSAVNFLLLVMPLFLCYIIWFGSTVHIRTREMMYSFTMVIMVVGCSCTILCMMRLRSAFNNFLKFVALAPVSDHPKK